MRAAPQEPGARPSPYCFPGEGFGRTRPERMEEMTVPLDDVNDISVMDAAGVPRAEIARRLGLSRNTVAKYADMADMSTSAPAHGSMPFSRPIRAHLASSAIPRSASMTGWSRRGATRAPTPQRDATCASGETLTAKAPKRAISSSSGRRGPRRSTTTTSRPWWPESASRSSCSSSRCRTPTPATPGPACPSARSARARASRGFSGRSGARRQARLRDGRRPQVRDRARLALPRAVESTPIPLTLH